MADIVDLEEPESGEVFTMTNGEKIRIEFDRVFTYSSKAKGKDTVIELGWSDDKETYILDIEFDDFDAKVQEHKKAWRKYWETKHSTRSIY